MVSGNALRAAQVGLDRASALAIGASQVDVVGYGQRVGGVFAVGAKAELEHRISRAISVGASGWAEHDTGGRSLVDVGAGAFLRWRF